MYNGESLKSVFANAHQMQYFKNGAPLMIPPKHSATFIKRATFLELFDATCFGTYAGVGFDIFSDFTATPTISSGASPIMVGEWIGQQASGNLSQGVAYRDGTTKAIGEALLSTGTSTTGMFTLGLQSSNNLTGGYGYGLSVSRLAVPNLSTVTDEFVVQSGWQDNVFGGTNVDGVCWKYDRLTLGADTWRTSTQSNSTETVTTASGFTVATGEMPYLGIFVNGDWTNVEFFYSIDGKTWTFSNVHTTNIPTGSSRVFGYGASIRKTAGTTARTCSVDLLGLKMAQKRGS